jgi:hypothetical protein
VNSSWWPNNPPHFLRVKTLPISPISQNYPNASEDN